MSPTDEQIINHTTNWIRNVVVGCNFCPFAARVLHKQSLRLRVSRQNSRFRNLDIVMEEMALLDSQAAIETSLLIFPTQLRRFPDYLQFLDTANRQLRQSGYQGIYQIASFHPAYAFEGSQADDPANYTNRSPYPMLHFLREAGLSNALAHYPNPELIPEHNMRYAREQGLAAMQLLLAQQLQ